MTGPPPPDNQPPGNGQLPDNQPPGNGQLRYPGGAGHLGDADSVEAQRTMLASFWALVLSRFRAYVQRDAVADRDPGQEGR